MRKLIFILAATTTLAACQTVPSGVAEADWNDCSYEADKYTPSYGNPFADGLRVHNLRQQCLYQKGYRRQ